MIVSMIVPTVGQPSDAFVVGIGYDFGVPLWLSRTPPVERWCSTCNGDGSSYNHVVRLTVERRFSGLFSPRLGGDLTLSLGAESGRFTSDPYIGDVLLPDGSGGTLQPILQREIDAKPYSMRLEFQLDADLGAGFRVRGGPWGTYRLSDDFIVTEDILSPAEVSFLTGSRSRVVASGDSLGVSRISGGLTFGGSYELRTRGPLHPRIELHSHVDGRALSNGLGLRAFSVGGGMALVWSGTSSVDEGGRVEFPLPPLRPVSPPPRTSTLDAVIDLYGVGTGGEELPYARLDPQQVRHTMRVPVLPAVFFDSGSAEIPERYLHALPFDPRTYSIDSLVRRPPIDIYHDILNILGMRMSRARDARIIVRGHASPEESPSLAERRAEAVRRYLEKFWSLDRSRIELQSTPEGGSGSGIVVGDATARRVDILSTDGGMFDPVTTTWIEESYRQPTINLKPSITSDAGVRSWSVTVRQGDRVIQRTASDGSSVSDGAAILVPDRRASPEPLVAELVVEDSIGAVRTVRDTLPLRISDAHPVGVELERAEYIVLPEAGNPSSDRDLERQLRTLASSVESGAHVVVQFCDADHGGDGRLADAVVRDLGSLLGDRGVRPELLPHASPIRNSGDVPVESRIFDSAVTVVVEAAVAPR